MENKNQTQELANEVSELGYAISDLKSSIDSVAGELFALVKVLESKRAVDK